MEALLTAPLQRMSDALDEYHNSNAATPRQQFGVGGREGVGCGGRSGASSRRDRGGARAAAAEVAEASEKAAYACRGFVMGAGEGVASAVGEPLQGALDMVRLLSEGARATPGALDRWAERELELHSRDVVRHRPPSVRRAVRPPALDLGSDLANAEASSRPAAEALRRWRTCDACGWGGEGALRCARCDSPTRADAPGGAGEFGEFSPTSEPSPGNAAEGLVRGISGLSREIGRGFVGVIAEPARGASEDGAAGLAVGVMRGLVRATCGITAGTFEAISLTAEGTRSTIDRGFDLVRQLGEDGPLNSGVGRGRGDADGGAGARGGAERRGGAGMSAGCSGAHGASRDYGARPAGRQYVVDIPQ